MTQLIQNHKQELDQLIEDAGIKYLAVFGSHARGDDNPESDVDMLVDFQETPGLIGFLRIEHKLQDILKRKVDLVTKNGLSRHIKPYIQDDLEVIYEQRA